MKILKKNTIFLDKNLTEIILSNDLMEHLSPHRRKGFFRKRAADPLFGHSYPTPVSYDRRAL